MAQSHPFLGEDVSKVQILPVSPRRRIALSPVALG